MTYAYIEYVLEYYTVCCVMDHIFVKRRKCVTVLTFAIEYFINYYLTMSL